MCSMLDMVVELAAWPARSGPAGPLLFACIFVFANALFVPASLLTVVASYAFGFWPALCLSVVSRPAAAAVGFGLSRSSLRRFAQSAAQRYPQVCALDRAIAAGGLRVVLLLRLSPLFPSSLTSILLGTTALRLTPFVAGSAIGTLPSTTLAALAGAGLSAGASADIALAAASTEQGFLWGLGLVASAVLIMWLYRAAQRELRQLMSSPLQ